MDNGLTREQAAEVATHLAFYSGWPNVFSALPVVKDLFEKRAHYSFLDSRERLRGIRVTLRHCF